MSANIKRHIILLKSVLPNIKISLRGKNKLKKRTEEAESLFSNSIRDSSYFGPFSNLIRGDLCGDPKKFDPR